MSRSSFLRNAGPSALLIVGGKREGYEVPVKYDDVKLTAKGAYKQDIEIVKRKPGKFAVTFPADIPKGARVMLRLFRATIPPHGQPPLGTLTVTAP